MAFWEKWFSPKKKQNSKIAAANDFVNMLDIRKSLVYTRDGFILAYIQFTPINVNLLSDDELFIFINRLTSEMSVERKPFKLHSVSLPVDMSGIIEESMEMMAATHDVTIKNFLQHEILHLTDTDTKSHNADRLFYFTIWEPNKGMTIRADIEERLLKRAEDFVQRLASCGIYANIAESGTIIKFINQFNNSVYISFEDSSVGAGYSVLNA